MKAIRKCLWIILLLGSVTGYTQRKFKTENIVLITLDGMRWQEVFGGAEQRLIGKPYVGDSAGTVREFWAPTPEERRMKLMPFLWTEAAARGVLLGNRNERSFVNVTNKQWFSYPGYSELLCGFADDERIHSNDKFPNPNKTVLEFIHQQQAFKGKVRAYTSWDVFTYIINSARSGIMVNAGQQKAVPGNEREKLLNELMGEVPNPLGDVRLDAFTFYYAFEDFKRTQPRVLYLSFDETDDFAHQGKYDAYLKSAHAADGFIRKLWDYCQSQPKYKGKTTFIVTCDHGRGDRQKDDWRHHGIDVPHADEIWMAVIGPDTPPAGQGKATGQFYQSQVARTMAVLLGVNYQPEKPAGEPIAVLLGN